MSRDPQCLHVGLVVLTPDGPGIIRARRGGPVTTWLAGDCWWRESQLVVPEAAGPSTGAGGPRWRDEAETW